MPATKKTTAPKLPRLNVTQRHALQRELIEALYQWYVVEENMIGPNRGSLFASDDDNIGFAKQLQMACTKDGKA